MANAKIDGNYQKVTIIDDGLGGLGMLHVEPVTGGLVVDEIIGTPSGLTHKGSTDDNHYPVSMGSSSVDGTPIPICVDANGRLLVHIV
jgi:hypothetical protein